MYFPDDGKLPKDMDITSTSCLGDNRASADVEGCSTSNQRLRQPLEETNSHQLRSRFSSISILWLSCSETTLMLNVYVSIGLAFEIIDDSSINATFSTQIKSISI